MFPLDLSSPLPVQIMLLLAASMRILTFFFLVPFLGGETVPGQARLAVSVAVAFMAWPTFTHLTPGEPMGLWFLALSFKEVFIGIVIGYTVSILFWAMLSTGFLADNQRGASMGQSADPISGEDTSLLGAFMHQLCVYLLFSTGAFAHMLAMLLASYAVCPPGFTFAPAAAAGIPLYMMDQFMRLMVMALLFAAPILLVCLFTDISLGIVNRFAPQLNVFFLSMPIKSALGLAMIVLYMGTILPLLTRELFGAGNSLNQFWNLLRAEGPS